MGGLSVFQLFSRVCHQGAQEEKKSHSSALKRFNIEKPLVLAAGSFMLL